MEILLTNDDSHDSPLFLFAIEKLRTLGNLTIVVPREEQSWTGKSMTRFGELTLEEISLHGGRAYTLNGTPADCANLGIYHLYADKPDLVVSGINIGVNTGVAFAFSSGTIGACLEANIAGVPAVALSQRLGRETFVAWEKTRKMPEAEEKRLRTQSARLLDGVFQTLFDRGDFWDHPVTWNVNLPFQAAPDWKPVSTFLGHSFYGSCFKKNGGCFRHNMDLSVQDTREKADRTVIQQGHVSVTRLDIRSFGQDIEVGRVARPAI